ncbi:hypothetical protein W97_08844 [Coniosporium apollinis CBS 100218]|uniref:SRP9 domain-containing protein n=1 Tax=Coniosporium apollinis (strain CBS 100218) TaxID=1168221 RepID=R7Z6G7_CONA1|nr:uncharacterized protein W97_08844 [Coniosporium apollinis CBS 100218]EON69584.1 hypothetical protein W97_08844 [Coniosporium apollinis CBS 100218]
MPYFTTSQEWFHQSSLLLQARPTTTRITSKYTISSSTSSATARRKRKAQARASDTTADANTSDTTISTTPAPSSQPAGPKATLTLKTFDPESGVCLKYQTTKAAEVGRLIASLGKLGRGMAGLAELAEDATMVDAPPTEQGPGLSTPVSDAAGKEAKPGASETKAAPQAGGGGGKKRKKGKK